MKKIIVSLALATAFLSAAPVVLADYWGGYYDPAPIGGYWGWGGYWAYSTFYMGSGGYWGPGSYMGPGSYYTGWGGYATQPYLQSSWYMPPSMYGYNYGGMYGGGPGAYASAW